MGNIKRNEPSSFEEMEEQLDGNSGTPPTKEVDPKMNDLKLESIDFLKKKGILVGDATSWKIKFEDGREFDIVDLIAEFAFRVEPL
jgi:hypothetical protein